MENSTSEKLKKYKRAFAAQKNNAKTRGIEFLLTFQEWLDWWGDDIDRRGQGACCLQMQRYADKGPYVLGNIKKGYPRDNSATWAARVMNRKAEKAKRKHQEFLDALMYMKSRMDYDEAQESKIEDRPDDNGREFVYLGSRAKLWGQKHGN